jgi:hypothetical protein
MTMDEELVIARRARDRIARGWCRNLLSDGVGNVCAMGALNFAWHGSPYYTSAVRDHIIYSRFFDLLKEEAVSRSKGERLPCRSVEVSGQEAMEIFKVTAWNNSRKSKEEVLEGFDAAIRALEVERMKEWSDFAPSEETPAWLEEARVG